MKEYQEIFGKLIATAEENRKKAALEGERKEIEKILYPQAITRPHETDEQYVMRRDAPVLFAKYFSIDKGGVFDVEGVGYRSNSSVMYSLKSKKENAEHDIFNFGGRLETIKRKDKETGNDEALTEEYDAKCLGCEYLEQDKRQALKSVYRTKNPFHILTPPQERCPQFEQCDKPPNVQTYTHKRWITTPIESKRFIKINAGPLKVLHIEIDEPEDDLRSWRQPSYFEDRGVPVPNCIVESDRGVHVFYFLAYPISRKNKIVKEFYEDVRMKIIVALGADPLCNIRGMVRNPFYEDAASLWFREDARTLEELNTNVKLESKYGTQRYDLEYRLGNRNNSLFLRGLLEYQKRRELYTQDLKNRYRKQDVSDMERFLKGIIARHPKVEAFPVSELRTVARNIILRGDKYKVRAERDYGRLAREGLAGPDVGPWSKSRPEREAQVNKRRAWGAGHSARIRSGNLQREAMRAIINYRHAFPEKHLPAATLARISCVSARTAQQPGWKSFLRDRMGMPISDLETLLKESE